MSELNEIRQNLLVPSSQASCCKAIWKKLCRCCYARPKKQLQQRHDKSRWEQFRDWARRKTKQSEAVYQTLLELYADEDVIEKLLELSLEPVFDRHQRDDLEFYIPQLLNFLLYGEYRLKEELLKYVLEACRSSFSFSHRVLWFLKSTDFSTLEPTDIDFSQFFKSVQIISRGSQGVYLSPSLTLAELISARGAESMIDLNKEREKREVIRPILEAYAANETGVSSAHYLNTLSVPLHPFGGEEDGFHSTISFVKALTDIASDLLSVPNKLESLRERLSQVNCSLPAGVYLPFTKQSLRESAVLWLRTAEAKVFVTKVRAPYMVCIEVFNPAEELKL
jgi:phosphatidylinositol 4-kinase